MSNNLENRLCMLLIDNRYSFVGPQSLTLQIKNISESSGDCLIKEKSNCFPHINNNDGDSIILITNIIIDNLIAYNYRLWILISTLPLTIYVT